jgi:hypothetical protein
MTRPKIWIKFWPIQRKPDFIATFPRKVRNWSPGWYIQLRVEPDAIRNVNIFFEKKAWGAFRYEVYPSYDFVAVAEKFKKEHA